MIIFEVMTDIQTDPNSTYRLGPSGRTGYHNLCSPEHCRYEIPCALEKRRKYTENENSLQAYIEGSLRCPWRPKNRSKRRKIFEEGKYLFCGGINKHIIQITKKVQKNHMGLWHWLAWSLLTLLFLHLGNALHPVGPPQLGLFGHPSWASWVSSVILVTIIEHPLI